MTRALVWIAIVASPATAWSAQSYKGKIVKLDPAIGKVVLTHGAIPKLDMPAGMTMGYRVEDKTMLGGLKAGDSVTFDARDDGGTYTITKMEKAK